MRSSSRFSGATACGLGGEHGETVRHVASTSVRLEIERKQPRRGELRCGVCVEGTCGFLYLDVTCLSHFLSRTYSTPAPKAARPECHYQTRPRHVMPSSSTTTSTPNKKPTYTHPPSPAATPGHQPRPPPQIQNLEFKPSYRSRLGLERPRNGPKCGPLLAICYAFALKGGM